MSKLYNAVQSMACKIYKKHKTNLNYDKMIDEMICHCPTLRIDLEWSPDFAVGGSMYTCFTSKILLLPETIINGFGQTIEVDKNHFMIQIFRIPLQQECTLENILRIACYTGMLQACMKTEDFPEGIVRTYKALDISSLAVFLDINKLTIEITKEQEDAIVEALIVGTKH